MPTVDIEWIRADGAGGTHFGGIPLRVPGTLPGDRVEIEVTQAGKQQVGHVIRRIKDSPLRIAPTCVHDSTCGGCDLSSLAFEARPRIMSQLLSSVFRQDDVEILAAPAPLGHRARIKLTLTPDALGYQQAASHAFVPIEDCEIARPEIRRALVHLRSELPSLPTESLDSVELRSDGERVIYSFFGSHKLSDQATTSLASLGDVAYQGRAIAGDPVVHIPVNTLRLRASPTSFYQVHLDQNEKMVDFVLSRVAQAAPERVLDLYAGIGNFALPLARLGLPVVAVESSGTALKDLRQTANTYGITGIKTITMLAERFAPSDHAFDLAVLDPPRAGAGIVLANVLRNRPRRVIYIACHAPSAARDIQRHAKGYRVHEVVGVDIFPPTRHVEAIIVLDRES